MPGKFLAELSRLNFGSKTLSDGPERRCFRALSYFDQQSVGTYGCVRHDVWLLLRLLTCSLYSSGGISSKIAHSWANQRFLIRTRALCRVFRMFCNRPIFPPGSYRNKVTVAIQISIPAKN